MVPPPATETRHAHTPKETWHDVRPAIMLTFPLETVLKFVVNASLAGECLVMLLLRGHVKTVSYTHLTLPTIYSV